MCEKRLKKKAKKQTKKRGKRKMAGVNNNLKPFTKEDLTREKQSERGKKGGIKSQQVQREKKTLAQIFSLWADGELKDKDKLLLESIGVDSKEATNKYMLIIPIIKNLSKGDAKALQIAMDLLSEDKRKEKEIEKLQAEIERLRLETQKLKNELNGDIQTNKVIIINDVPKGDDNA